MEIFLFSFQSIMFNTQNVIVWVYILVKLCVLNHPFYFKNTIYKIKCDVVYIYVGTKK